MKARKSTFKEELAIVPRVAWFLAVLGFVCGLVALAYAGTHGHHPHHEMPYPVFVVLVTLGAFVGACWVLLLGYVNRDAARRGMGPWLWTLVCIFVPNCLGFLIYFIIRKPFVQYCPQCGEAVSRDFRFCPKCNFSLAPTCPSCGHAIERGYSFCPYCGKSVGPSPASVTPSSGGVVTG